MDCLPLFQGLNKTIICPDCLKRSLERLGSTTSIVYLEIVKIKSSYGLTVYESILKNNNM